MKLPSLLFLVFLAACATGRGGQPEEYVEIPNPAITMSPNAPATVWVPRRYVDSGVPRGTELVKNSIEKLRDSTYETPQGRPLPLAVAPDRPQNRLSILAAGDPRLARAASDILGSASVGPLLDPAMSASLAQSADLSSEAGRGALARRLQQKYGTQVTVYLSAPLGLSAGKNVFAEIYDGLGGELVTTVSAKIAAYAADDAAAKGALADAYAELCGRVEKTVALLPWYATVVAVEGDRVYLNAGKASGVSAGQRLALHAPGKVIPDLGFAPGKMKGTLTITGLVGTDGAFGSVDDGNDIRPGDLVSTR